METSTFSGDNTYSICCTGDCCTGDDVAFERATFTGSFRNAKFAGFERIEGRIVKESYGMEKQQHTFTLDLGEGKILRIKGRNLYTNGTYRKPWANESARYEVLDEKHERGAIARADRDERKIFSVR